MEAPDLLYDLLFELLNETRHKILFFLSMGPIRVTEISSRLDLTSQEASRHISRLMKIKLINRDNSGEYRINNFGLQVLQILEEFEFISIYQDYLLSHNLGGIPAEFLKRMGELKGCRYIDNVMIFLSHIDNFFNESIGNLSLIFNQFPLNSIDIVKLKLEQGMNFRVIGPKDGIISPDSQLGRTVENFTKDFMLYPLVEYKILDPFNIILFVSSKKAVISFPTLKGDFDYRGFVCEDLKSIMWFQSLFGWYWDSLE